MGYSDVVYTFTVYLVKWWTHIYCIVSEMVNTHKSSEKLATWKELLPLLMPWLLNLDIYKKHLVNNKYSHLVGVASLFCTEMTSKRILSGTSVLCWRAKQAIQINGLNMCVII